MQREIKRFLGAHCAPLRDKSCRPDTNGAPRSAHPTVKHIDKCNPQELSIITCKRVARHGHPPGDPLLPFGQFTLCRACVESPVCVAAKYLALRKGKEMGGQWPPLRKKKSSVVLLFEAVAALRFSPDYPKGKGVIHKRVETVGVYPLVRPRGVSADLFASQAITQQASLRPPNPRHCRATRKQSRYFGPHRGRSAGR